MKALVIHQPWAGLVAAGAKRLETRGWQTHYRGDLVVVAGMHWDEECCYQSLKAPEFQRALAPTHGKGTGFVLKSDLPFGSAVCVATVLAMVPSRLFATLRSSPRHSMSGQEFVVEDELAFGNWATGRVGWLLGNLRPLKHPVKLRGRQGLWSLSEAEGAAVRRAL